MNKLTYLEKFTIEGRGDVYACLTPEWMWGKYWKDFSSTTILIDDKQYTLVGLERFAGRLGNVFEENEKIGLLVEEHKHERDN